MSTQEFWFESHIALGASVRATESPDDARRLYSALVEQWKDGDNDLVLLKTARERLGASCTRVRIRVEVVAMPPLRCDFFPSTSPKTATAFFISSIVPNEMRQCVFSNGGKSRATSTPFARHASRNSFAGRPMLTNMKFACESVGFMPRSANHFIVKSRTALLRARSAVMNDGVLLDRGDRRRACASTLSELVPRAGVPVAHLLDRVRVADRVADAQARHAVRLRERPRDDDARVFDGERNVRVVIGIGDVVEVGLVDEDRRLRATRG